MASTAGAYGLQPVGLISGAPVVGHTRFMKISSAYNTSIFNGDLVKLVAAGVINRETADAAVVTCGVFLGCSYTDATMGFIQRQYWPASTTTADAFGYVCDDPNALFKIQADDTLDRTCIGANAALTGDANGSTTTGKSGVVLDASTVNTTNTLPLRIIDFWDADEVGSAFPHMIVKINTAHQYNTTTGV